MLSKRKSGAARPPKKLTWRGMRARSGRYFMTRTQTKNYVINKGLTKYGKKNIFSISINEKLKVINCF